MAFSAVFMSIAVPSQVTLYFISDEAHIWAPQATGAVVLACTRACMLIAIEAIRPHSILYKCYGSHAEHVVLKSEESHIISEDTSWCKSSTRVC
eukprot:1157261-Pelagomonas_calceolata.AAC.3